MAQTQIYRPNSVLNRDNRLLKPRSTTRVVTVGICVVLEEKLGQSFARSLKMDRHGKHFVKNVIPCCRLSSAWGVCVFPLLRRSSFPHPCSECKGRCMPMYAGRSTHVVHHSSCHIAINPVDASYGMYRCLTCASSHSSTGEHYRVVLKCARVN